MTNVGVTGHQYLPDEVLAHVTTSITAIVAAQPGLIVGYSSLAAGSDQLFARILLDAGGVLIAVIPCQGYEKTLSGENLTSYRQLLKRAHKTITLEYTTPSESAFMAANEEVIKASDLLIAVWDGLPASGFGGTADAVWLAWSCCKPVVNVWPKGVSR